MYLRRLFSDKRIKLVYPNRPSEMHLSCPVNDGRNRTAFKTCLKYSMQKEKKCKLAKKGAVANIAEGQ